MKRLAFFSLLLLAVGSNASAALVTGVTSSNSSAVSVSISGISHTPQLTGGSDNGSFTLDVTVNELHVPVDFIFTYSDEGAGASAGEGVTRQYFMTVNVTNNVDPSAGSDYMNGFDLINAAAPVSGDLDSAQLRNRLPTNITDLTFEDDGGASKYNISNGFRFGGLAGGGKALYNGDSGSAIIQYTVTADADRDGGSRLTFTANPEPGTLALAGLALFPLGIAVRRRRKAAQQAEEV